MSDAEDGLTLVEVLIALAVLAVIVAVLGTSIVVGLRVQDQTIVAATRVIDEQLVGTYWNTDVQSAASITTGARCAAGDLVSPEPLISFSFVSESQGPAATWYEHATATPDGETEQRLARVICDGAAGSSPSGRVALASPLTVAPELACETDTGTGLAPQAWAACSSTPISQIRTVAVTLRTTATSQTVSERTTVYVATRRVG